MKVEKEVFSIIQRTFSQFLFLIMIVALILLVACQEGNQETFPEISKRLSHSIKQLDKEPGITLTGFGANPDNNLFKVGIAFDANQISMDRLKQVIDSYLSDAASDTQANNWTQMLKPYRLRFERIGEVKTNFPLIAEKERGATELTWMNDRSLS